MNELLDRVERQLVEAIGAQATGRRARRRGRLLTVVAVGALLAAVSAASAISGDGPLADVLGVERDDPTLRSVQEVRDAPRAVVRVRGDDGHLYTFAGFHVRETEGPIRGRSICSTQARNDATRVSGLGCIPPRNLARLLHRNGLVGGPTWGSSAAGGLRVTTTASGFVPGRASRVTLRQPGEPPAEAKLSDPIPVGHRGATTRAFLATLSYDNDGPGWLDPPLRRTVEVTLANGTTRRRSFPEPRFFPMVDSSRPESPLHVMRHPGREGAWRSVGYRGEAGTICTAAAPAGERLMRIALLQCSAPLAVVNAVTRYGAALYLSNFNPRRERGPRTVAAFGFARADATGVTIVDQRGRRYEARLSRPWTTVTRRPGDLAGVGGALRRRLERLPKSVRVRSYIASLDVPPEPLERGLRVLVR
jgi:hypothetical protein